MSSDMQDVNSKWVVITGAGSGMGAVAVDLFAARGWSVLAVDREIAEVDRFGDDVGVIRILRADLSDPVATRSAADNFLREVGAPTALVCFAGWSHFGSFETTSDEDWKRSIDANLMTAVSACLVFGVPMRHAGRGSIVLTSSTGGLFGIPEMSAYTAAKHAVVGLARSLAVEWGRHDVRVNCIAPGATLTPMLQAAGADYAAQRVQRVPLGRLADPRDQVELAYFLCSPEARNLTGVILPSDGGISALAPGTATSAVN